MCLGSALNDCVFRERMTDRLAQCSVPPSGCQGLSKGGSCFQCLGGLTRFSLNLPLLYQPGLLVCDLLT